MSIGSTSIEQYNRQLAQSNLQKQHEIQILKKQMDLALLSSHLQRLNHQKVCEQCLRKEQQIETLIKAIKSLRNQNVLEKSVNESQNINKVKVNSYYQNLEIRNPILQQNSEFSKNQSKSLFLSESNQLQLRNFRENTYVEQIKILKKSISLLQQKIVKLEQQNAFLKSENKIKQIYLESKICQNSYGITNLNNQKLNKPSQKTTTGFSSLRGQIINKYQSPHVSGSTTPKFQSLLTDFPRKNTLKDSPKCTCGIFNPRTQMVTDYSRSRSRAQQLHEERRRSLNHKIKFLQGENRKLKTQII